MTGKSKRQCKQIEHLKQFLKVPYRIKFNQFISKFVHKI